MLFCKGNQTSRCQKLEEEIGASKTEGEQIKLKHNGGKTVVAEKPKVANGRLDPIQGNELGQVIEKEREEKREIESRLLSEKNAVEKKLLEHKEQLVVVKRKNERLTKEINEYRKKNEKVENHNKALVTKNKDLLSKIKTEECDTSECDELRAELDRLRKENKSLKKGNADSLRNVKDLEKSITENAGNNEQ